MTTKKRIYVAGPMTGIKDYNQQAFRNITDLLRSEGWEVISPIDKFRRQQHRNFMMTHEKVIVMAIKPKYAKAIYEGKKTWEFRKNPPPLNTWIAIYESAPSRL